MGGAVFASGTAGGREFGFHGNPIGNPVKPAGHGLAPGDRSRPADQDQKYRLKGVLRVLLAVQQALAQTEYHRPLALEQGGKSRLIVAVDKQLEEFSVRQFIELGRSGELTQVMNQRPQFSLYHLLYS